MTPEKLAEFLEQQKRGNWIRTHELRRLQMKFPPWLWDACNNALEDDMNAGDRSYALNRVFNPVMATLPRYPIRPTVLLQPSPSIDALRSVLARAPDCANMYKDNFTGIDMTDHWNGAITYSWSNSYLDDLFNACIGVIREHGVGDSGWRTIRWEVYDMHSRCIEGICWYSDGPGRERWWVDDASHWFCDCLEPSLYDYRLRAKVESGRTFNSLLPSSTSGQVL